RHHAAVARLAQDPVEDLVIDSAPFIFPPQSAARLSPSRVVRRSGYGRTNRTPRPVGSVGDYLDRARGRGRDRVRRRRAARSRGGGDRRADAARLALARRIRRLLGSPAADLALRRPSPHVVGMGRVLRLLSPVAVSALLLR